MVNGECPEEGSGQFPKFRIDDDTMTVELCVEHCRQQSGGAAMFAALRSGRECGCKTGTALDPSLASPQQQCSVPCGGEPAQMCGGQCHNSVFRLLPGSLYHDVKQHLNIFS